MEFKGVSICVLCIALVLIVCYEVFEKEFKNSYLYSSDENECYSGYKMCPFFMISSIPFLVITFVVYGYITEIRNLHSKCLMSYIFSFVILYATSSIIELYNKVLLEQHTAICTTLGYLWMTAILCCCFWSNVMCYDIWMTFKADKKMDSTPIFIRYCLYAFGIPMILEIINYFVNHFEIIPDSFNHRIGVNACKIFASDDKAVKIAYIYGPLVFCLIINIIFYLIISVKLYRHQKQTTACRRGTSTRMFSRKDIDFNKPSLYGKLAISMGILWIIEVTSSLIPDPRLYFLAFVFFNIQGPLIFVAFVCNAKVKRYFMKRLSHQKRFASRNDITEDEDEQFLYFL